ncbi:sugar kinase [Gracilibacillus sp. YIM 98692]|uniref:sugar kinase n=1 Tax=Gracilibacillus sp. YIM 98692 TaxID=2663532 RepID=UPI0013D7F4B5|nr:sugar kinase [Gracilibacillus sp. YIM 98692]
MDVVTIGETMALFTPNTTGKMRYESTYSRKFGGAESNFAIGLHRLGYQTGWISKVGKDELGEAMLAFIRGEGVDVTQVKMTQQSPTGVYFKEIRNEQDVRVYYYRAGSAASTLTPDDLDEAYIASAKYLHLTGITPALSESCYQTVMKAIEIARENHVKIIFDPNIREKLWNSKEQAHEVLMKIASQADIILPGISEARYLLGDLDVKSYAAMFIENGAKAVILKEGSKGAHFFTREEEGFVPGLEVERVIDPVGAGDGFAAGVTSGILEGLSLEKAIERGNAVGAMVTMVNGDVEGLPEMDEITRFMQKDREDVNR